MSRKFLILFIMAIFVLSACSAQTSQPTATQPATQTVESVASATPALTPTAAPIPRTEAEVPRVSLEEAKAAIDSGAAIVVDVRSAEAYQVSHIPGAINIQLGEFETKLSTLNLDKNAWIITYCT